MSTMKLTGLMLMFLAAGGFGFAQTQKPDKPEVKTKVQRNQPAVNPVGRGITVADREKMFQERMAKQTEAHKASMKELEDIKKIAESEKATKTADAIQKLIDKKDAEFKKTQEQLEQMRKEHAAQLQEKVKKTEPQSPNSGGKKAIEETPKK